MGCDMPAQTLVITNHNQPQESIELIGVCVTILGGGIKRLETAATTTQNVPAHVGNNAYPKT